MTAAAFTGHRPSGFKFGYDERDVLCGYIKNALFDVVWNLYKDNNVRIFYSGAAQGTDTWASEAVLLMRNNYFPDVQLICVRPFPDYDVMWPTEQQKRMEGILAASNEVITVCDSYYKDAYKQRNFMMIERSQYLVAVYDFKRRPRSGTMQTVNHAVRLGLNIVYIDPTSAEITYKK